MDRVGWFGLVGGRAIVYLKSNACRLCFLEVKGKKRDPTYHGLLSEFSNLLDRSGSSLLECNPMNLSQMY